MTAPAPAPAPVPLPDSAAPAVPSFRAVLRELGRIGGERLAQVSAEGEPLVEMASAATDPPRLVAAVVIEGGALRAYRVEGDPEPSFDAFLDGTQSTRVAGYSADGVPIVFGKIGAVVRHRRNRRMGTWAHSVRAALFAPRRHIAPSLWSALETMGVELRDTTADAELGSAVHPFALRDLALHAVQHERERAEQELAELWCRSADPGVLFVDGGLSGSEGVARSTCTVGVVKSHRTFYAEGEALRTILGLRRGERSSVFRIASAQRAPVASFYLRLRDPVGHDPMWGLVRVEMAHPDRADEARIGERANEVSRWILAEASPLSLPDGRWDKMVYGIRDCEEFLRAVTA